MGDVKLIVGLGNPGTRYAETRHNLGFRVVDVLAGRLAIDLGQEKFHAWFGTGAIGTQRVVLLKPTTFMNRSGQAVIAAVNFYRVEPADLLVISDDHALPVGHLRMRAEGSAGGHNGLQDIVDRLDSDQFARQRIGIGMPIGPWIDFVLTRFSLDERSVVEDVLKEAADQVECWAIDGVGAAMNKYNTKRNRDDG